MKKTSLADTISESFVDGIIDPSFDSARITGLQTFLDCLGDADGIARADDIDLALRTSYFDGVSRETLTWSALQLGIEQRCFTKAWLQEHGIEYLSTFVEEAKAAQQTEPEKFELLFLLLPDAIRANELGVTVRVEWVGVAAEPTKAYALHFVRNTPPTTVKSPPRNVAFVLPGSASNPHSYTERALELMQQHDEVVVFGPLYGAFSSPQTELGWGFGLEHHAEAVIHERMAAVVEAEIVEQIKMGPIALTLEHHSAGLWQNAVWYNRFQGAHGEDLTVAGVRSFGGSFGFSRTGGLMSNQGLTGMFRFFYSQNQKLGFASAKTEMVTKMYAGGDVEMAQRFCDKGQGYGDLSWSALAALPKDFSAELKVFLESVIRDEVSLELDFAVNDHSVSVADAVDALLSALAGLPEMQNPKITFHIYGLSDFNEKGDAMSRKEIKRLRQVLQKHDVVLDETGQISASGPYGFLHNAIVFHPGDYPGHFVINSPRKAN